MDTEFCYNFPALRGKQAEKEFYVVMCPLKLIPKIFLFDEEEIPAEHRAQRILNRNRVPDITNYILENPKDYVFSSLTASIDGEINFEPYTSHQSFNDLGRLSVSLEARFLINDGQHRRAAIEEALKISPELGNETISVVFFSDLGLKNSQQIFSDLNRHAVNTTSSIGILYDHRDKLALITKEIINTNPILERYTDMERVSLSMNSPKIIALNHIFNTNLRLLKKSKGDLIDDIEGVFLKIFWKQLCENIVEWNMVFKKELSPRELRSNFIICHGLVLEAIGMVGHYIHTQYPSEWKNIISKLSSLDWGRRNSTDWLGRAFSENGRIQKSNYTIQLTANKIKEKLNIPLTEHEQKVEDKFRTGEHNA